MPWTEQRLLLGFVIRSLHFSGALSVILTYLLDPGVTVSSSLVVGAFCVRVGWIRVSGRLWQQGKEQAFTASHTEATECNRHVTKSVGLLYSIMPFAVYVAMHP